MLFYILPVFIGYLLGSISPSYFLAKLLKNVDIRQVGDKNAGTTNTYNVLGFFPAVITAIFDLSKGLLAMWISYVFGATEPIIYLAGLSAIVGHIFPFYLQFRGGQGVAVATGLLFYSLIKLTKTHSLPFESLGILAVITLAIYLITKEKTFLPLIVMPALIFLIFKNYQLNYLTIFTGILLVFIFFINIYEAKRLKVFKLKPETVEKILPWRTVLRPFAVVFPIAYFYLDKSIMLWILGIFGGIPFILDSIRLVSSKINLILFRENIRIFKKKEKKRYSSITLFLVSAFFTVLLFERDIAISAMMFLIFGDVFAKFFGSEYGKTKIGDKTLEGSIAFFSVSLLVAYLIWPYIGLSPLVLVVGAFVATVAEIMPFAINDNFIIALSSGSAMMIMNNYIL